jgi:hypothetical protein
MNKKSIIFVEPKGSERNVFDNHMRLPLLGSLYLEPARKAFGLFRGFI